MDEKVYRQCVLETWPCGCRMWYTKIIVGETIEQQDLTRSELCWGLETLFEREPEVEGRAVYAYLEHGEHSLEYKRAASDQAEVRTKIEKHYHNRVPSVEILNE